MAESEPYVAYVPSVEKRYGQPIDYWIELINAKTELTRHGELVSWLKAEHGVGHGHATALVAYALKRRP